MGEVTGVSIPWSRQIDRDELAQGARAVRHDGNAVAQEHSLFDIVRDQQNRGSFRPPNAQYFLL